MASSSSISATSCPGCGRRSSTTGTSRASRRTSLCTSRRQTSANAPGTPRHNQPRRRRAATGPPGSTARCPAGSPLRKTCRCTVGIAQDGLAIQRGIVCVLLFAQGKGHSGKNTRAASSRGSRTRLGGIAAARRGRLAQGIARAWFPRVPSTTQPSRSNFRGRGHSGWTV